MTYAALPESIPIEIGGNGAVRAELAGHVLLVTINRPEARNAVNVDVWMGIGESLSYAESARDVWAVVLTGAGDVSFCAGADLKAVARGDFSRLDPKLSAWGFGGFVKHHISKPIIAAVNGFALGGGTEFVLHADLAVAADSARLGLPEVKRGIYAGAGGTFRLPQQIPPKIAMEMTLTGEAIDAPRALSLGLLNAVVPAAEVVPAAFELASRITANAPLAVQASKRIARGISEGAVTSEDEHWARNDAEGAVLLTSEDAQEGPRAFAEKRSPVWSGQ